MEKNKKMFGCLTVFTIILALLTIFVNAGMFDNLDNMICKSVSNIPDQSIIVVLMKIITHFADVLIIEIIVIVGMFLRRIPFRCRIASLLSVFFASYGCQIFKNIIYRSRPDKIYQKVYVEGTSYPSGHASRFVALCAIIFICFLFEYNGRRKKEIEILLIIITIMICSSRIILCAHFLTDVLAGGLFGIIIAILIYEITEIIYCRKEINKTE